MVAILVVEMFEVIDVDQNQSDTTAKTLGAVPFIGEDVVKVASVGNRGQPVGVAEYFQLGIGFLQRPGALLDQGLQLMVALVQPLDRVDFALTSPEVWD